MKVSCVSFLLSLLIIIQLSATPADVSSDVSAVEEITVKEPVKGLIFDGTKSNSFINLGNNPLLVSPSEFTVEAVVYFSSLTGGYIISSEGWTSTEGNQGYSLRLNNGKINFSVGVSSAWSEINAPVDAPLNKWIHVAAVYSTDFMRLYVDGLMVDSKANPGIIALSSQNLIIGEGSAWKNRRLSGRIGYIRLWNKVRTPDQIRLLINEYSAGTEQDLIAAWNNDIRDNTILFDKKSTISGVENAETCLSRGKEIYELINQYYRKSNGLYNESYPGQSNDPTYSYLWPYDVMVSGATALYRVGYGLNLTEFVDNYQKYYNTKYVGGKWIEGYASATNGSTGNGTRFYDDNSIVGLNILKSYEIFNHVRFLERSSKIVEFLKTGKDNILGGGLWWNEDEKNIPSNPNSNKPTCSNGYATFFLLNYYKRCPENEKSTVLAFAKELYDWLKANLRDPADNCYWNDVGASGVINKTKWTYNTGVMIQNALRLYEITLNSSYLDDAIKSAEGSYKLFLRVRNGVNASFPDYDPWFNVELAKAYINLSLYFPESNTYVKTFHTFINHAYNHARNANGFFYEDWTGVSPKRYYYLLMQAPVVEAFGLLSEYYKEKGDVWGNFAGIIGADVGWFDNLTTVRNPRNILKGVDIHMFKQGFRVINDTDSRLYLQVFSLQGVVVEEFAVNRHEQVVRQLNNLNGYYIVRCENAHKEVCFKKIVLKQ